MALDGGFLHCLLEEISSAVGSKVDKVYQPARDELVLLLRSKGFNGRLFISANPSAARLHFTNRSIENPPQPPMLCMLLRKHLVGARLISAEQYGLDRVAILTFEGINELGDTTNPQLIIELMGAQSNIILAEKSGRIIDSVRRSDIEKSERMIQPGATYRFPEAQGKLSPLLAETEEIAERVKNCSSELSKAYLSAIEGVSPLISRELALMDNIEDAVLFLKASLNKGVPCLATADGGQVVDFSYMELKQYGLGAKITLFPDFSALLDHIYGEKDLRNRIGQLSKEITKLLSSSRSRIIRKLEHRRRELEQCRDREKYRIWGELLKANLHLIPAGAESVRVCNYYDPEMADINIPLKSSLSGSSNAAYYFKEYKKLCNAERLLGQLIADGEAELDYIESVTESLGRAESITDIAEITAELESTGYMLRRTATAKKQITNAPKEYVSPDGFKILVGRNNIQNDKLTFKTAAKEDVWLHVKDFPGAHVIIISEGCAVPQSTILFAAEKAAENTSKVNRSASVPVDYTYVKRVKKQPGGKPGMVTYTEQKTVYVTPPVPDGAPL